MRNAGLEEAQAGIKIAGRNINNLRYADDTTLMAESEEELKSGEWKTWLKAQHSENEDPGIWSHHFMGNRWETVETVSDFIFGGSKITSCEELTHWKRPWHWEGLRDRRKRGWKRMRWLDGITNSMDIEFEWTPGVGDGQGGLAVIHGIAKSRTRLSDRTEQQ